MNAFAVEVCAVAAVILVAASGGNAQEDAGQPQSRPVKIEVLYTEGSSLQYYSLTAVDYRSQFTLSYYEYLGHRGQAEASTQFVALALPGSVGRQLVAAFDGLDLSWNPSEYYWERLPEHFDELPEDHVPCGMVVSAGNQLVACPMSGWASAQKSPQANNVAWFIDRLDLTRCQFDRGKHPAGAGDVRNALLEILQKVGRQQEVQTERSGSGGRQIPAGLLLRTAVAQALVYGGLLEAPMRRPEVEIRRAAADWYADRLPQEDARRALLQALSDKDSRVRAAAATALAAGVAQHDSATIEALRGVLQREPDPFVRQVIQDLLDGATLPRRNDQRNGS